MEILNVFSATLESNNKPPKPDFVAYCYDLAKQESARVNSDFLTTYFGFSFTDLFDQTIACNKILLSRLQAMQYCIIAHATPEYDPDYSHIGVYLKNRYAFLGEIIDVIGDSASIQSTALHLLTRVFDKGLADQGAIIYFEQPIVPVSKQENRVLIQQAQIEVRIIHKHCG